MYSYIRSLPVLLLPVSPSDECPPDAEVEIKREEDIEEGEPSDDPLNCPSDGVLKVAEEYREMRSRPERANQFNHTGGEKLKVATAIRMIGNVATVVEGEGCEPPIPDNGWSVDLPWWMLPFVQNQEPGLIAFLDLFLRAHYRREFNVPMKDESDDES